MLTDYSLALTKLSAMMQMLYTSALSDTEATRDQVRST